MKAYEVFVYVQESWTKDWELTERVIAPSPSAAAEKAVFHFARGILTEYYSLDRVKTLENGTVVPDRIQIDQDIYTCSLWEIIELPEHVFMEMTGAPRLLS